MKTKTLRSDIAQEDGSNIYDLLQNLRINNPQFIILKYFRFSLGSVHMLHNQVGGGGGLLKMLMLDYDGGGGGG